MISKIEGLLEAVQDDQAHLRMPAGFTLEVLLPAFASARLGGSLDQPVTLHTLMFLESQNQGASFVPRLAGFLTSDDRAFYQLFITCKGIGQRKALRAMALATPQLAAAIADRDHATLQSLPEIGRRTAETVAATLHDKVDRFIGAESQGASAAGGAGGASDGTVRRGGSLARESLEVLLQLGESRAQAAAWIDQALTQEDAPRDVQAVIAEVYRIKAGAG